jgi:hypothetical protein
MHGSYDADQTADRILAAGAPVPPFAEVTEIAIPAWLTELFKQFPSLAIVLVVAYFGFRHIARQHSQHLADVRKQTEEMIRMLNAAHDRTREAKQRELDQLLQEKQELMADRDRLRQRLEVKRP